VSAGPSSLGRRRAVAAGLVAGVALDLAVGDPRRGHPVAAFGTVASRLEAAMWRDSRRAGAIYAGSLVAAATTLGAVVGRGPSARVAATTAAGTWAVLGGRSLVAEARAVDAHLAGGDLPAARQQLTHLVGRRTDALDAAEVARATIESVAENTSDAVVAPLFWGAVAGLPGLLGYRAINTLDAMVGHHSPRFERFGWAAARVDDLANYVPARLTAGLSVLCAPVVAGGPGRAAAVVRRDGRAHPSPNAGPVEAAFAGALGVRLGGRNEYGARVEDRPVLGGAGRAAAPADIARAARLSRVVTLAATGVCAGIALLRRGIR
jgi:adenosylcobinamide-phosphate synthase